MAVARLRPVSEVSLALRGHFKAGRTPNSGRISALLKLAPQLKRTLTLPDKTRRVYRWSSSLPYLDGEQRAWTWRYVCEETLHRQTTTFAWLTNCGQPGFGHPPSPDQVDGSAKNPKTKASTFKKQRLKPEHVFSQTGPCQGLLLSAAVGHLFLQLCTTTPAFGLGQTYAEERPDPLGALRKSPSASWKGSHYFLPEPDLSPNGQPLPHS